MYCKRLTKQDLIDSGIDIKLDEATKDIKVYRNGKEATLTRNKKGYLTFAMTKGNELRAVTLSRAVGAWVKGEVPEGYVIDHINNKHLSILDYRLDNLQCITPKANVNKDLKAVAKEKKCHMKKPRSFYEGLLAKYEAKYEQAKKDRDAEACHKGRSYISQTRARLRYWDSHKDEYDTYKAILEYNDYINKKIAELRSEIRDSQYTNAICKENGWNAFWHAGNLAIKLKKDKIRELKKNLIKKRRSN